MRVESRPSGHELARCFENGCTTFGTADVAAGVADANAVRAKFGEWLGDIRLGAHAIDDKVPFFRCEFFSNPEPNPARATGDESNLGSHKL